MICAWIRCVKRAHYNNATRRLTFVVKDKATAMKWHRTEIAMRKERLTLLCVDKLDEEDVRTEVDNVTLNDSAVLQYQVRILAPGIGIDVVDQVISLSTECKVISVARQALKDGDLYDSNFWIVVFDSEVCPPQLQDVTHIEDDDEGEVY